CHSTARPTTSAHFSVPKHSPNIRRHTWSRDFESRTTALGRFRLRRVEMRRRGCFLGALAGTMAAPSSGLAPGRAWEWDWSMHPMMFMWGAGGLVMMLMMLVFWGLVIAGLIVSLRWLIGQGRSGGRDEAFEILRQRYARGEIDKQEFEARKRDL